MRMSAVLDIHLLDIDISKGLALPCSPNLSALTYYSQIWLIFCIVRALRNSFQVFLCFVFDFSFKNLSISNFRHHWSPKDKMKEISFFGTYRSLLFHLISYKPQGSCVIFHVDNCFVLLESHRISTFLYYSSVQAIFGKSFFYCISKLSGIIRIHIAPYSTFHLA